MEKLLWISTVYIIQFQKYFPQGNFVGCSAGIVTKGSRGLQGHVPFKLKYLYWCLLSVVPMCSAQCSDCVARCMLISSGNMGIITPIQFPFIQRTLKKQTNSVDYIFFCHGIHTHERFYLT